MAKKPQSRNPRAAGSADSAGKPPAAGESSSLGVLLAVPVVGAIFGSSAFQLGAWILCFFSGGECAPLARAEGGMMAVAIGFVISTAVGAEVARRKNSGADTIVTAAAVGVLAGLYSAFKAMPEIHKLPDPTTIQFAFFVLVAGMMFVLPTFVRPHGDKRWAELMQLYGRMAVASLVAGAITLVLQSVARLIPDIPGADVNFYAPSHPSFFLARPAGVGLLIAPWIILAYDPLLSPGLWASRPRSEALGWTVGFWALAAALVAAFVGFFYWPDHQGDRLDAAGISLPFVILIFLALLLSPLAAAGVALWTRAVGPGQTFVVGTFRTPIIWAALGVALAGSVFVSLILFLVIGASLFSSVMFAAFHMIAAAITLAVGLHFGSRLIVD